MSVYLPIDQVFIGERMSYPRIGLLMVLAALSLPNTVVAQDGTSSRRVQKLNLNLEDFVSTGNVEKPQVQYFISREEIRDATPLDLKESFLDRINKSLEESPF